MIRVARILAQIANLMYLPDVEQKYSKTFVIGASIVGASILQALVKAGAPVTLLGQGAADSAGTARSFDWINVNHGTAKAYDLLRQEVVHA